MTPSLFGRTTAPSLSRFAGLALALFLLALSPASRAVDLTNGTMTAVPVKDGKAPAIDGNLSDWPPPTGSTAGEFRLVGLKRVLAEGFENFAVYARSLSERFPIRLKGEPSPRISDGLLCLNDPASTQVCLAVFHASHAAGDFVSLADLMASSSSQRA